MFKDFLKYDNLDLMPRDRYNNLLQTNKMLINEINIMKIKLRSNSLLYSDAERDYKKIVRGFDIPFLRRLMYEQEINFSNNNVLINFSIEDDNINLEQNILLRRLINHKKMRNLIKFFVLKKYCSKLTTSQSASKSSSGKTAPVPSTQPQSTQSTRSTSPTQPQSTQSTRSTSPTQPQSTRSTSPTQPQSTRSTQPQSTQSTRSTQPQSTQSTQHTSSKRSRSPEPLLSSLSVDTESTSKYGEKRFLIKVVKNNSIYTITFWDDQAPIDVIRKDDPNKFAIGYKKFPSNGDDINFYISKAMENHHIENNFEAYLRILKLIYNTVLNNSRYFDLTELHNGIKNEIYFQYDYNPEKLELFYLRNLDNLLPSEMIQTSVGGSQSIFNGITNEQFYKKYLKYKSKYIDIK
jgi:hypothetical protein